MFAAALSAQQSPISESIEVSIVNVDVHVTDKAGNRVPGLTAKDFEVREDGKLQPITNFSEFTAANSAGTVSVEPGQPAPAAPSAAAEVKTPPRTIIIFIEPITLASFRAKELFDSIRALMRTTVRPGDRVSIMTFTRRTTVHLELTSDLNAIERALDQLQERSTGVEGNPTNDSRSFVDASDQQEKEFEAMMTAIGLGAPRRADEAYISVMAAARRQLFMIRQKIAALQTVMQSISGAEGKKVLILATRRLGLYAGAEYFSGSVPPHHRQELDTAQYRKELIRSANTHGVAIYAVHPEGLSWTSPDASASGHARMNTTLEQDLGSTGADNQILLNETAALGEVAKATGGISAWGSSDIAKILPSVRDDLEAYYSIGYRATATGKDGTRNIVVTVKNPAYRVRSRQQYVESSEATRMKDRVAANLFQRVPDSTVGIPFQVAVDKITKDRRNRWSVPLQVRVPIGSLTLLPRVMGRHGGEFSVYVATGGVLGVMSEVERKTQPFEIQQADLERAKTSHFTYQFTISVDRLVESVSIGVLDEVGKEYSLKRFMLPKRE